MKAPVHGFTFVGVPCAHAAIRAPSAGSGQQPGHRVCAVRMCHHYARGHCRQSHGHASPCPHLHPGQTGAARPASGVRARRRGAGRTRGRPVRRLRGHRLLRARGTRRPRTRRGRPVGRPAKVVKAPLHRHHAGALDSSARGRRRRQAACAAELPGTDQGQRHPGGPRAVAGGRGGRGRRHAPVDSRHRRRQDARGAGDPVQHFHPAPDRRRDQ